jgi:hypothetical protein
MRILARRPWWSPGYINILPPVRRRDSRRRRAAPPVVAIERLEDRTLLSTFSSVNSVQPLDVTSIDGNTAEKPQSKTWEHAGTWWSVFSTNAGTHVFRLDGTSWTSTLTLSTQDKVKADVVVRGDVAHVLMERGNGTRLASIQYVPSTAAYEFWSERPGLVSLPLGSAPETATIDVDSTGRMWLAYDERNRIDVRYSDAPYAAWSSPITVATGITDDDIAAVVAFGGQVGVLWSDQNTERFGFRVHVDGTDPLLWSANEVPAAQSALDVGGGMADDHINLAAASDGTLYAAIKTSYNRSDLTDIGLLVRRPEGTWDPLYEVDTSGTRPIVQLNEMTGSLLVIYRQADSAGPIVYRESSTSVIAFGDAVTLLSDANLNNPSGTKRPVSTQLVVIAAADGQLGSARVTFGEPVNQAPFVDAGADQMAIASASVSLDGTVFDDGLPNPPATVTTAWTLVSGPGGVSIADPSAVDTMAVFDTVGTYVLRLVADDNELITTDTVTITVNDGSAPITVLLRDGVDGYAGTRDTRIRAAEPDRNLGRSDRLQANGDPDSATLIGWDLSAIPAGSRVVSASITLFVLDDSPHTFEIYALLRPWDELEASFNSAASGVPWQVAGAQGAADRGSIVLGEIHAPAEGTLTVGLNSAGLAVLEAWIADPASSHGFTFQDYVEASNNLALRARNFEVVEERPALTITYLLPDSAEATLLSATSIESAQSSSSDSDTQDAAEAGDRSPIVSPSRIAAEFVARSSAQVLELARAAHYAADALAGLDTTGPLRHAVARSESVGPAEPAISGWRAAGLGEVEPHSAALDSIDAALSDAGLFDLL